MAPARKIHARYGPPASEARIATVEADLGVPIPAPLRKLYAECDGLWFDELCRDAPPDDDTEWYEVIPLRLLRPARDQLVRLYGGSDEDGYQDFEEHLARCVPFSLSEGGASFRFMTDRRAWGLARNRVGGWNHDGGEQGSFGSLRKHLTRLGQMRSRGE
jgi:hypothetical protein